jgi:hypothetical protein
MKNPEFSCVFGKNYKKEKENLKKKKLVVSFTVFNNLTFSSCFFSLPDTTSTS